MDSFELYLQQFLPHPASPTADGEEPEDYALRMQSTLLPNWPTEVLVEWLYRHADYIATYAHLRFETLTWELEDWPTKSVPAPESFTESWLWEGASEIEEWASPPDPDWLANYMLDNGTWNSPVILLSNPNGKLTDANGEPLRCPYHLLEGHRRFSYFIGLQKLGRAKPVHKIWVARKSGESDCSI